MMLRNKAAIFRESGQFIPPPGVSLIWLTMQGAGGGGGGAYGGGGGDSASGGSSGELCIERPMHVEPGVPIDIVIGQGGAGGNTGFAQAGATGGATYFGTVSVNGARGGNGSSGGIDSANVGGGYLGGTVTEVVGHPGTPNWLNHCGGSSGGGSSHLENYPWGLGGQCGGTPGAGPSQSNLARDPGGGGAAGLYGTGGLGGDFKIGARYHGDDSPCPAGGGGGGGVSTTSTPGKGGRGGDGIVIITWIDTKRAT